MKKYNFRLEQVRRVRRTQEDVAKAGLQNANSDVQRAIVAVEARLADYEQSSRFTTGVTGADAFMKQRFFNELAGEAVVIARAAQAAAEEVAAVRRAEWSDAAMKVKVLDRLDERRREEFQIEADRDAEKEVDDLVTGRYAQAAEGGRS